MADKMDLDPQLRGFLDKSNLLQSMDDVSDVPVQELRQACEKPYRYAYSLPQL